MLRLADGGEGAEQHRGDGEEDDDLLPLRRDAREALQQRAQQQRHGGELGRGGEEGGDRRRRALVDVGRPHVERHGGDLEGEADQQEHEADDEADVLRRRLALRHRGDDRRSRSSR